MQQEKVAPEHASGRERHVSVDRRNLGQMLPSFVVGIESPAGVAVAGDHRPGEEHQDRVSNLARRDRAEGGRLAAGCSLRKDFDLISSLAADDDPDFADVVIS